MTSTRHDVLIPGPPRVQEVGEGVFAYLQPDGTWWINNTGFLVGSRGVISVDSCSTVRRTRAYLDAISGITTLPVRTLVNTHHHARARPAAAEGLPADPWGGRGDVGGDAG